MSTAPAWVTTLFCPLLGVIISNAVGTAPVKAVMEARRNHSLGSLSPLPFALITNSCLGWVIYGVYEGDYFIFFSNAPSLLVGLALCLTAIHILEKTVNGTGREDSIRNKIEFILMSSACFWVFIIFITGIVLSAPEYKQTSITIVGAFSVVSSLLFYGAPLINMVEIVKQKDSSSLYAPALMINGVNCLLWFFYGLLGVYQVIVWLPNIIGLTLVCVELGMCCIYPAKRHHKTLAGEAEDEPVSDYAVYSSSRHMSAADMIFPLNYMLDSETEETRTVRANSNAARASSRNDVKNVENRMRMATIVEDRPMSSTEESKTPQDEEEENPYYTSDAIRAKQCDTQTSSV